MYFRSHFSHGCSPILSVHPESELMQGGCEALYELETLQHKSLNSPHTEAIVVQVQV